MDNTYIPKQNGRHSKISKVLLLLFLAGLQPVLSADELTPELDNTAEEEWTLNSTIVGPDYVTVGVPSSVACYASCLACTYSMSLDRQVAQGQGNVLAFTVNSWVDTLTVTCSVTDDNARLSTTTKKIQVLAGPANVSITGPDLMNPMEMDNFKILICKATNSVSGLFVTANRNIAVTNHNLSTRPEETSGVLLLTLIICAAFTL
uniref:uncharacterized protein LOC124053509 isoform X5 n=1 Tax=Scatophagus argus TaxID=75038 RepID=UPI001ED826DF|nr:uncharacterized protein LOC124053509 isoform X5 [Scatophagus argus]